MEHRKTPTARKARRARKPLDSINIQHTTHNAMFGLLVENCIIALLRAYLPRKYLKLLDLNIAPEVVTGDKVDDSRRALRSLHCDALLKVPETPIPAP